jgi:hypothetical protein
VAQCQGRTRKGERCKRDAKEGSAFCSIHIDQEVHARADEPSQPWDRDALVKTAIGFGLLGAILFFRLRR